MKEVAARAVRRAATTVFDMRSLLRLVGALVIVAAGFFAVGRQAGAATERTFVTMAPSRLLDSRPGEPTVDGTHRGIGAIAGGTSVKVRVSGRAGVPTSGVAAVTVNVTAVNPAARGFVTVYAAGTQRPLASNLNTTPGMITPNLVIAALGADGSIELFTSSTVHLVVDIVGWYPAAASLVTTSPSRLLDTRPGEATVDGAFAGGGRVQSGTSVRVPVVGRAGLPGTGVGAVIVNVTAVDPVGLGFVTVFASGTRRPTASNLNVTPGLITPNLVVASVGSDGRIELFASNTVHLVVDIMGWYPGSTGVRSVEPARLLETRSGLPTIDGQYAGTGLVAGGTSVRVPVIGRAGVPSGGVGAVVLNVTAVNPSGPGFVTAFASGAPRPTASNLNLAPGVVTPNLVMSAIGQDGRVELFTSVTTDLVVDVAGWYPIDEASPPAPPPPPNELIVVPGAAAGGNGSVGRPFASLQQALNTALPGNVIRLAAGDHVGKSRTVRAGVATDLIRIVGSPGARLRNDGTSRLLEIAHSYITLEGVELANANVLVTVIGANGVKLLGNSFHDAGSECLRVRYQSSGTEIANNTFRRCGLTGVTGGSFNGEAIYIGTAPERLGDNPTSEPDRSNSTWVHDNDMLVPGECVDIKEDADNSIVERNMCTGSQYVDGAGLSSRGHGTIFRSNNSSGHLGSGVMLTGDRASDGTGSIVEGNTLTNNGQYGLKNVDRAQASMCGNVLTGNGRGATTPAAAGADRAC